VSHGFSNHDPSAFMAENDLRLKPLWPEITRLRLQHAAQQA